MMIDSLLSVNESRRLVWTGKQKVQVENHEWSVWLNGRDKDDCQENFKGIINESGKD